MENEHFDVLIFDPNPILTARNFIVKARRAMRKHSYVLLLSETISLEDALKSAANDCMSKPIDPDEIYKKIDHATHLIKLINHLGDDSEDFPSAGGVIAKSAFNQLFLSGMERADRYGEKTHILSISLNNYTEIMNLDGAYTADYAVAKLCQYIVKLRRQSDIVGQTGKNEYSILLQHPNYATESFDAANRFTEQLSEASDIASSERSEIELKISLTKVPSGEEVLTRTLKPGVIARTKSEPAT